MGLFDRLRGRKPAADNKKEAPHYHTALDYYNAKETDIVCPECEKAKKHVHLVKTEGKEPECPECHYIQTVRR